MIETKTVYVVKCDYCGQVLNDENSSPMLFLSEIQAADGIDSFDWSMPEFGKVKCPDCK